MLRGCANLRSAHFLCFNCFTFHVWIWLWLLDPLMNPFLACLFGTRRNDTFWANRMQPELLQSLKCLINYLWCNINLILCHCSLPVHDIWLWINSTLFLFSPLHFSLTDSCSSLICSLLVWAKTIDLSPLPPYQSSVDHKEFKRCGPFDPYINAKVCTKRCWKHFL